MNGLEIVAMVTSFGYVFLNARQNIWTWVIGLASSLLYSLVFYQVSLFASSVLSLIFACFMVYGWFSWKKQNATQEYRKVRKLTAVQRGLFIVLALILSFLAYIILRSIPTAQMPPTDALIFGISVIAQYLAAKRCQEAWVGWFIVNIIAVYTYMASGIYYTGALYLLYVGLSCYGLILWRRSYREENNA